MESKSKETQLKELWRQYQAGDNNEKVRERLMLAYAPLVKYVAGRLASGLPANIEEADLISYGLMGLVDAIDRYEPKREVKFESFALSRIKGAIIDELRSLDWVPRSVRNKMRLIEQVNADLEKKLQRAPTDEEVARELGMTVEKFHDTLTRISNSSMVALDELWAYSDATGDTVSFLETLGDRTLEDPVQTAGKTELKKRLSEAVSLLPEREKLVIALYYYENLTLREISEVMGISESRVSQLHTRAVLRLKGRLQDSLSSSISH